MLKLILSIMLMSAIAWSGSTKAENKVNYATSQIQEVVSPLVATSMYRTGRFTYDARKNILICMDEYDFEYSKDVRQKKCKDSNDKNAWRKMKDSTPPGTQFVGFKSVSQGTSHQIEIYWKDNEADVSVSK